MPKCALDVIALRAAEKCALKKFDGHYKVSSPALHKMQLLNVSLQSSLVRS